MRATEIGHLLCAPPFLKAGALVIAQTANTLLYLGPRLGLVPKAEASRLWAHQLQLTIADFVAEIHDVHHPIAGSLYYHQQKREARRRSKVLLNGALSWSHQSRSPYPEQTQLAI